MKNFLKLSNLRTSKLNLLSCERCGIPKIQRDRENKEERETTENMQNHPMEKEKEKLTLTRMPQAAHQE